MITSAPISLTLQGAAMEFVEIAGLHIAYQRAGNGPPLLLLHGGMSDSREWRRQIEGLSDEFTVVAWDTPGCGQSSDPPETFEMVDFAGCLAGFIDALGLGRPHIAGLSFGSVLALALYRWHPQVPRSLVLASAYAGWAGSLPPEVVEARIQQVLEEATLPPEQFIPRYIEEIFTEPAPPEVIGEMARIMSDVRPAAIPTLVRATGRADLRDVLPLIDVPVLLLYGDADQRSPLSVAEAMHDSIPTSELVVMPGVGHASNMEAGETFNAEVRRFLRSVE
jgi:pimeloyl-ACP methyl ester carboxylesterase